MAYVVRFSQAARRDLTERFNWIARNDSPANAEMVLDRVEQVAASIASMPFRGSHPAELPAGLVSVRQVFFKLYRVIYSISGDRITIQMVADGRRSLQSQVLRRLTED